MLHSKKNLLKALLILIPITFFGCSSTPNGPLGSGVITGTGLSGIRQDVYHEVARLETLWRISKMYGVDAQTIAAANGLKDPTSISVGQKLLIPQAAAVRPVIPVYNTRRWSHIVIHHSATNDGNALTIDQMHYRRGFGNGLGYHFLIDNGTRGKGLGQIEIGPRWIKQADGAHANAAGMNENGIGICLIGNFSETRVPELQLESLEFLVNVLRAHYRIPLDHIIRHRDVPGKNTECPGNYFPWEEFKRRLKASN
ncbi:MAG: N-acetylmuramoyl-L-alanine amidase [Candidatus Omnitrophica bacterium]|nr:N-acetylmuramoyl-L-alanine amidase [Candidatus Omnitrophota bacterium]